MAELQQRAAWRSRTTYWGLMLAAAAFRGVLLLAGDWQDHNLAVKYTDIDYEVFTDAAGFVHNGGSPFQRSTYRYTPLLAYLLLPNHWGSKLFGKVLFAVADLLVGHLTWGCIQQRVPRGSSWPAAGAALWLLNPLTAAVSTRGNGDALVMALLLAVLRCLHPERPLPPGSPVSAGIVAPAVLFGLAVHWRIFPALLAPAVWLALSPECYRVAPAGRAGRPSLTGLCKAVLHPSRTQVCFGAVAAATFAALGGLFYALYGHTFLHEAYLHHLGRRDPRHNFSIHFYNIYLMDGGESDGSAATPLDPATWALLPCLLTVLMVSARYAHDLPFAWLLAVMCFVTFNKVCTAQYFVWYIGLLPVVLPNLRLTPGLLAAAGVWGAALLAWLGVAYLLEFQGQPVHLHLWACSTTFLFSNVAMMCKLMAAYRAQPSAESDVKKRT